MEPNTMICEPPQTALFFIPYLGILRWNLFGKASNLVANRQVLREEKAPLGSPVADTGQNVTTVVFFYLNRMFKWKREKDKTEQNIKLLLKKKKSAPIDDKVDLDLSKPLNCARNQTSHSG